MTVYLVGAGPGDPGLITVRGAELLAQADVVIFDRLVSLDLLDMAPADALRIDAGKRPGEPRRQDEVNAALVAHGRTGKLVVRLKGGDPFVFGRGGEEAQALLEAGVPFEVVPGVSSAFSVPASVGVPVTHRGLSASVTVVTGRVGEATPGGGVDWEALARLRGTIVVLMGLENRAEIATRLMAGGRHADTPVVAVQWGTTAAQRSVRTTLRHVAAIELGSPTILVVGEVAGLDLGSAWARPLAGVTVAVTRAASQAASLSQSLRDAGASVVAVPVTVVAEPDDGGAALKAAAAGGGFDWVVLTSANAAERFVAALGGQRLHAGAKVAVVGPATAAGLGAGLEVALVAQPSTAEGLVAQMPAPEPGASGGGRVLYPRAEAARDVVVDGLEAKGWQVDDVVAYRTVVATPEDGATAEAFDAASRADVITFASPSAVAFYLELAGIRPLAPTVACIGPVTADAARRAGLTVSVVADEHSAAGLVAALIGARLAGTLSPPGLGREATAYDLSS